MTKKICDSHKPNEISKYNYVKWSNWAEEKIKNGESQTQCEICGKWLFECEM